MKKSVRFDETTETFRYPEEDPQPKYQQHYQNLSHSHHHESNIFSSPNKKNQQTQMQSTADSTIFHLHATQGNQDFNFNQVSKYTKSPMDMSVHQSHFINTMDMEKMKHASKHCPACEAKYR